LDRGKGTDLLLSVLGLGLLMGMQHAFEADHLAAVSSLVSRRRGIRSISWHGAIWGIGHTLTLLLVAGTCIVLKTSLDKLWSTRLELAVGVMLVLLGAHVLWRLWRDRVHIGVHEHADGTRHLHAHSHRDDRSDHAHSAHDHDHPEGIPWRTLLVGTMHGMAGSAALVVLAASSISSPWWGLLYVLLFGLGSVVGMALLSAVIALPLSWTARSLTIGNRALQAAIGIVTIAIGVSIVGATGASLFGVA
jgi:ABC-type nickel/cobalt efflux system permease component RcnA